MRHCDNESAIDEAIREARELGEQLGASTVLSEIKEMKERLKAPRSRNLPEYEFFL